MHINDILNSMSAILKDDRDGLKTVNDVLIATKTDSSKAIKRMNNFSAAGVRWCMHFNNEAITDHDLKLAVAYRWITIDEAMIYFDVNRLLDVVYCGDKILIESRLNNEKIIQC